MKTKISQERYKDTSQNGPGGTIKEPGDYKNIMQFFLEFGGEREGINAQSEHNRFQRPIGRGNRLRLAGRATTASAASTRSNAMTRFDSEQISQ